MVIMICDIHTDLINEFLVSSSLIILTRFELQLNHSEL